MHKKNIERRMQNEHIEDWSYWSQRRDSLKRYPKQESLDPSWYTDNIYSNHSLDLDGTDVLLTDFEKFDQFLEQRNGDHYARNINASYGPRHVDVNDNSDQYDDDDLFDCNPRGKHATGNMLPVGRGYRYPKSRSCCFGGGYETQKTVSLLPKSSTFSTARAKANLAKIREVRSNYDQRPRLQCFGRNVPREDDVVVERLTYRRSVGAHDDDREQRVVQNDFSYLKRSSDRNRQYYLDDGFDSDIRLGKPEIDRMRNQSDYIRNEWLIKNKPKAIGDLNGNVCDDDDPLDEFGHFDEMDMPAYSYHENRPGQRRRMSCDSDLEFAKVHDREYFNDIETLEQEFEEEAAGVDRKYYPYSYGRPVVKSKRALEVRAPSRFDDTSSDSTDVDLDDFNFDFEKYWEDLDKTNSAFDIDIQNNNTYNNLSRGHKKVKNINVSRYNNGRQVSAPSNDQYSSNFTQHRHQQHSNLLESVLAPSSDSSVIENLECDTDLAVRPATLPLYRYGHKVYPSEPLVYNHFHDPTLPPYPPPPPPILKHPSPRNMVLLPPAQPHPSAQQRYASHMYRNHHLASNTNGPASTTNPFSLISNIFSIYKPKKYSPLNCNTTLNQPHYTDEDNTNMNHNGSLANHSNKPFRASKKMNVASTVRPLGAPANDFITSLKRPLMVTPSPCVEQPHFKIIPEKTGLKISPLYRFDYDNGERKFMLRSTARPLMMFKH